MTRLLAMLVFAGATAWLVTSAGTRDMESYEHGFLSLQHGARAAVYSAGQPVYSSALGLGVRLPLHGGLGASPVSAIGSRLPEPVTFALLIALSICAAGMIVLYALEPSCGASIAWCTTALIFWSVPMVGYTIANDWPETAVTYCAIVTAVFVPFAMLEAWGTPALGRASRRSVLPLAACTWGLIASAHAGYWPTVAGGLAASSLIALGERRFAWRRRVAVVAVLAAVALSAVLPQVPDILHEMDVAGPALPGMIRLVEGARGNAALANFFPLTSMDDRPLFTFLLVALAALAIGVGQRGAPGRRLIAGAAAASIACALGASLWHPGRSIWVPSAIWGLRDPALAFALLSGAFAAAAYRRDRLGHWSVRVVAVVGLVGALQGPAYAASLAITKVRQPGNAAPWNWNSREPRARMAERGVPLDRMPPGARLALWPGVREMMRQLGFASTDFANAGYGVVTVWTKQRTMAGLVEPNTLLFNQSTDLSAETLCDAAAVRFLRLRYAILAEGVTPCGAWHLLPDVLVDGYWPVATAPASGNAVEAVSIVDLSDEMIATPALSGRSPLLAALRPLSGTAATLGVPIVIRSVDAAIARGEVLVLPVAYDTAWRASSGTTKNVGGLLALVDVDRPRTTIDFHPDVPLRLRALSSVVAQVLTLVGLVGFAWGRPSSV